MSGKDWDQRLLCSDGNCIGIIGSDGRCKECGKPFDGEMPVPEEEAPVVEEDAPVVATEADAADAQDGEVENHTPEPDPSGDDWEDRTLCIDGSCIGVVGSDGRCKVCGNAHPGNQP